MKPYTRLLQLFILPLLVGCNNSAPSKNINVTPASGQNESPVLKKVAVPALQISAYLLYDDGSLSSFDILNDSTIALWNTIGGEGDAHKPSHRTKIELKGYGDTLQIVVLNREKEVLNKKLAPVDGTAAFIVNDTGCEIVKVSLLKNRLSMFEGVIDFHCGE